MLDCRLPSDVNPELWAVQVGLERGMLLTGAELVQQRHAKAADRNQMSSLEPGRKLMRQALPKLVEGMREYLKVCHRQRGPKPVVIRYLSTLIRSELTIVNPDGLKTSTPSPTPRLGLEVACLITLRTLIDRMGSSKGTSAQGLAILVGRECEHELKVQMWERNEPALYRSVRNNLDNDGATPGHRSIVNVNRFNALLEAGKFGFGWEDWSIDDHFRVGWELISNAMIMTDWWGLADDPDHTYSSRSTKKPPKVILPKPGIREWLYSALKSEEALHPPYQPTVIPPKRWSGTQVGGYWTPYTMTPDLVRFKASQVQQRKGAASEYDALDMPEVYEALHFLQECPWRVNKEVLAVVEQAIEADAGIAGLPTQGAREKERSPVDPEVDKEAFKRWKRQQSYLIGQDRKRLSKLRSVERTVNLARRFSEFERFYFPHMLDFRGRYYCIPTGLSPQGDDLGKGLLQFAEGKPVTVETAGWLAINLANSYGVDKVSFDERIEWVEERQDLWLRIADDPFGHRTEWAAEDKPWQCLAAILDWVGWLTAGEGYVSYQPIAVDGTCNGLQHLSAMTRDAEAGTYVNLVPAPKPSDIYQRVGDTMFPELQRIASSPDAVLPASLADDEPDLEDPEDPSSPKKREKLFKPSELAQWWLDLFNGPIPRSFTKRQVMILPYGGSKSAFFEYTMEWLKENHPWVPEEDPEQERFARTARIERLAFMRDLMWDAVNAALPGAMEVMAWLRACAKKAAVGNQPIFWTTPAGFVVRHFYGILDIRRIDVKHDGTRLQLALGMPTKELAVTDQLRGIPPNFVHSLDAAAMVGAVNYAKHNGVTAFRAIHDSFGTHAADMPVLEACLRQAFVDVHESSPLQTFRDSCKRVLADYLLTANPSWDLEQCEESADRALPPLPPMGSLDIQDVLRSTYFFA